MWCPTCRAVTEPTEVVAGTYRCATCGVLGVEGDRPAPVNEVSLASLKLPRGYREEGGGLAQDFARDALPAVFLFYLVIWAVTCCGAFSPMDKRQTKLDMLFGLGQIAAINLFVLYFLLVCFMNRWWIIVHDGAVSAWMGPLWLPFWRPVKGVRPDAVVVTDRGVYDERRQARWYTVDAKQGDQTFTLMHAILDRSEAEAGRAWLVSRLGLDS